MVKKIFGKILAINENSLKLYIEYFNSYVCAQVKLITVKILNLELTTHN